MTVCPPVLSAPARSSARTSSGCANFTTLTNSWEKTRNYAKVSPSHSDVSVYFYWLFRFIDWLLIEWFGWKQIDLIHTSIGFQGITHNFVAAFLCRCEVMLGYQVMVLPGANKWLYAVIGSTKTTNKCIKFNCFLENLLWKSHKQWWKIPLVGVCLSRLVWQT